jgi:hypothetical protein
MFSHRKSGLFRTAILFLAIFAVLGVSMASTSAQHIHMKPSSGGQCDICVTAHVVSLEARAVFHLVGAVEVHERLAPADTVAGYQLLLCNSASSRGPPSLA